MKPRYYPTMTAFAVLLLASSTANAARGGGQSQGDNNGKPFQELNAIIDENRALIDANQDAIAALDAAVAGITADIAGLASDLDALEGRVAVNEGGIADLQGRVDGLESDVDLLQAELAQLRADHDADIADIEAAIAAANARISALEADLQALADDLNAQLAALAAAVGDNALAIDALQLQLTQTTAKALANMMAIGALEGRVDDLEDRAGAIEGDINDLQSQIDALDGRVTTNEGDIDVLKSFHTLTFSGVRTNLPLADANGWSICYANPYGIHDGNLANNIQSACNKANVMVACRLTGSSTLTAAAHAPRADVFFDTGTGRHSVHNANGVDWYYNGNYSMGFTHQGDGVSRNSCDTATGSFPQERVCYHTHRTFGRGWRCGTARSLNSNNSWERVVLHAD